MGNNTNPQQPAGYGGVQSSTPYIAPHGIGTILQTANQVAGMAQPQKQQPGGQQNSQQQNALVQALRNAWQKRMGIQTPGTTPGMNPNNAPPPSASPSGLVPNQS